jgi:hypothetical protein
MLFNICQKNIIILSITLFFSSANIFGQFKNFGTNSKNKPQPTYIYSVYAYYDIVREYGIGFQYQLNNKYSLDASLFKIYPYGLLYENISQWDYYDFQGYGFSIKPKFMFISRNRLYVGLNVSFEQLYHNIVPVEFYNGRGSQLYYEMTERKGYGSTIGISFGNKFTFKQVFIEPFVAFGATFTKTKNITHSSTYEYYNNNNVPKYPIEYSSNGSFFQTNIGVKIGLSFKKNKKHIAIDKKFDDVYIPKAISLNNYIKTIDYKKPTTSKYLKEARNRYKALNRNTLAKYNRYYRDTTMLYNKIDTLFSKIDRLIIKGNQ